MINVETGTGSATSETFCSVAFADLWHANRGCAPWATLTTAQKEEALRRAGDYMEQAYRLRWLGFRKTIVQALSWPRDEVQRQDFTYLNQYSYYPNDAVPAEVQNACAEFAFKAAQANLTPDLTQGVVSEKVDVLEVTYDKNSSQNKRYIAIERLLAPLLKSSSVAREVARS